MNALARATKIDLVQALDERLRRERLRLADKASEDFYTFFRHFAWPVLEPATVFVDNWHVHALCEHLQGVTNDDIQRLIVNMPFRLLKSTLVSQAWPSWEWIRKPSVEYLTGSYSRDLATRDAVNSRRIIESPLYQQAFGHLFRMTSDQNVKGRYENDKRGKRTITSTESTATGFGGNRLIVDDPISSKLADSEVARLSSIEWWRGTVATRFNDASKDAAVIVMQRLHEDDLSGYLLKTHPGKWEHLVFPMRYEERRSVYVGGMFKEVPTKSITTKLGFVDPRNVEGELLCPSRLNEETVETMEADLGSYHTSAQLQQRPESRGGTIFERENWKFWKELPQLDETIISVDCSFKDTSTSDYVAIQVIGRKAAHKYLVKRLKKRMGFAATVQAIRTIRALFPDVIATLIEDKANGSAVIETLTSEIPGVIAIQPEGGKESRAMAVQPQHEAGNFFIPDPSVDPEIEKFIGELASFPNGQNDDEVDAWTQGINWYKSRERTMGMFDHYKQAAAEAEAKKRKEQTGVH